MLDWSVELSLAVPHSVGLHGRLSWSMLWNCCTGQSFPKLGAVRFAGYWRAASKSRRTKSCITTSCELGRRSRLRHTRLRRQKVGCPRVLEPAKNRSPLIALRYVKEAYYGIPVLWLIRQLPVFTQSRTLVDSCLFHCRRQIGSQFRLCWTLAVVGWRKVLS